jgi:HSP20 family protein
MAHPYLRFPPGESRGFDEDHGNMRGPGGMIIKGGRIVVPQAAIQCLPPLEPVKERYMATTEPSKLGNGNVPAPWRSFRDELDRMFDRFNQDIAPWNPFGGNSPKWPSVDIAENEKAYVITAELPGMAAEDVDVSLDGGVLVMKGEKRNETKTEEKNYHLTERSYGAFQRRFSLPEGVDRNAINAAVDKGVLTVTLPKLAPGETAAKKIEVKPAS